MLLCFTANPPKLIWSHQGSEDYLDGINHVTHYYGNHTFDCLEIPRTERYLVTVQLTYHFTNSEPSTAVQTYFTLTRFRNHLPYIISKSDYQVPSPRLRRSNNVRQPVTMVRINPLRAKDRLCITASHLGLIYASKIDNFFGLVNLGWRTINWFFDTTELEQASKEFNAEMNQRVAGVVYKV